MENLDNLRQKINQIDTQLDDLLNQRFDISHSIALYKNNYQKNIYDPYREQLLLQQLLKKPDLSFPLGHIYLKKQLMFVSRLYQYQLTKPLKPINCEATSQFTNIGYTKEHQHTVDNLKASKIYFNSEDTLIEALINKEITTAIMSISLDNINMLRLLYQNNIHIHQYNDTTYLSNRLLISEQTHSLGIVVTLTRDDSLPQIINLFHFYKIDIQQLFKLDKNKLFIKFTGNIKQENIQQLLHILNNESYEPTLQLSQQ